MSSFFQTKLLHICISLIILTFIAYISYLRKIFLVKIPKDSLKK